MLTPAQMNTLPRGYPRSCGEPPEGLLISLSCILRREACQQLSPDPSLAIMQTFADAMSRTPHLVGASSLGKWVSRITTEAAAASSAAPVSQRTLMDARLTCSISLIEAPAEFVIK